MSKNSGDKLPTEAYRGVRDFYPEDQALLNYVTTTWREVVGRFGYVEYHASVLEPSELYKAKGVENEEIIRDQSYSFVDRGGREVTLRPEMTPTVARMVAARRREFGYPLRLYSIPNVFRYERPQRGRLREHWQLNVDLFGSRAAAADAELIEIAYEVMKALGAREEDFVIGVNSRAHLNVLINKLGLDDVAGRALMALLDRQGKMPPAEFSQELAKLGLTEAQIKSGEAPKDVEEVLGIVRQLGVDNARFDHSVVRGFDYYTGVIFEITDAHPDNNRTMFGGGRYDNLTALFDNEPLPGVGFGMGDVTVRDFLEVRGLLPPYAPPTKVYVAVASAGMVQAAMQLADELRTQGVAVAVDFGERKLGDQIKTADKHKIPWLIVVGQDELSSGTFSIKNLASGTEEKMNRSQLAQFFLNL